MIKSGLVSITFRQLTPEKIVALVVKAKQSAIEWGGDIHVPHGNLKRAQEVGAMTRDAGLQVPAYGSYYRLGHSEQDGLTFTTVRDTATALGANAIRVWAGNKPLDEVDETYWTLVVADAQRIADLAEEASLPVVFEYHRGTLTETNESAARFLDDVNHTNARSLWQPPVGQSVDKNMAGLTAILPQVFYFHVFHWGASFKDRRPLSEGEDGWRRYLEALASTGRDSFAMMEYVQDDEPRAYLRDAATLRSWLQD